MTMHYLFPREAAHTNRVNQALAAMRKAEVANFRNARTEVPEAAMIEWAEEHDAPNVNTPDRYDILAGVSKPVIGLAAVGFFAAIVLAMWLVPVGV